MPRSFSAAFSAMRNRCRESCVGAALPNVQVTILQHQAAASVTLDGHAYYEDRIIQPHLLPPEHSTEYVCMPQAPGRSAG